MKLPVMSAMAVLLALLPQTASAWCLFPVFPTYTAGYGGWGYPAWGYAPAYSGYGYGAGNCCSTGYGVRYSGVSYSSPACGNCCSSGCSSCSGSSISSEKPVPDPISDRDQKIDSDRDRSLERYKSPRGRSGGSVKDSEPLDGFRGSGSRRNPGDRDWGESLPDRAPIDSNAGEDFAPLPGDFGGERLNGDRENSRSFKPETTAPDFENPADPVEHNTKKPPMNPPVSETNPGTQSPASEEMKSAPPSDGNGVKLGPETTPEDFLSPESPKVKASATRTMLSARQMRSSHHDLRSVKRLAQRSRYQKGAVTQISSSEIKSPAPRWISLPRPVGQARL